MHSQTGGTAGIDVPKELCSIVLPLLYQEYVPS